MANSIPAGVTIPLPAQRPTEAPGGAPIPGRWGASRVTYGNASAPLVRAAVIAPPTTIDRTGNSHRIARPPVAFALQDHAHPFAPTLFDEEFYEVPGPTTRAYIPYRGD